GVMTRPVASITVKSGGAERLRPIAAILPFLIRMSPFSMTPLVTVRMRAFLMMQLPCVLMVGRRCDSSSKGSDCASAEIAVVAMRAAKGMRSFIVSFPSLFDFIFNTVDDGVFDFARIGE